MLRDRDVADQKHVAWLYGEDAASDLGDPAGAGHRADQVTAPHQ
jgi:hypothetical protein